MDKTLYRNLEIHKLRTFLNRNEEFLRLSEDFKCSSLSNLKIEMKTYFLNVFQTFQFATHSIVLYFLFQHSLRAKRS